MSNVFMNLQRSLMRFVLILMLSSSWVCKRVVGGVEAETTLPPSATLPLTTLQPSLTFTFPPSTPTQVTFTPLPTGPGMPTEPFSPQGAVYYVSPLGKDSNPGTEAQPWRTIQKAARTLRAGETVYIRAGTYREHVVPKNSGSEGQYITYMAYPGEEATLDGTGVSMDEWDGLIAITNRGYIRISGLRLIHSPAAGILAEDAGFLILEKNYINDTYSSGIGVWGSHDIVIDGNEVVLGCNDGDQEIITVAGTDNFEVRNNHVHDGGPGSNGGEGIDVKDGSSNGKVYRNHVHHLNRLGIYVDAWDKHTYNIEVFENLVHDNRAYGIVLASEMGGLLENISVYNNIAYHNKYVGIGIFDCCDPAPTHPVHNAWIYNNTLYNNGWDEWGGGISIEDPDAQDIFVLNNIVSQNLYFQIALEESLTEAQVTVDSNVIDGFRGEEGEIKGTNYIEANPLFVNPASADFHLQPGSPAIDRIPCTNAPPVDYEGNSRPQDGDQDGVATCDIGAFEALARQFLSILPLVVKN